MNEGAINNKCPCVLVLIFNSSENVKIKVEPTFALLFY